MPILLVNWGQFYLFSFGLLVAVGLLVSGFLFWRELRHTSWDEDSCFAVVLKSLIWSFVIARLVYVEFMTPVGSWMAFFDWRAYPGVAGLVFWLVFWLLNIYQAAKLKMDVWRFVDILAWVSLAFYFWLSLACWGGVCWLGRELAYGLPVVGSGRLVWPVSFIHMVGVLGLIWLMSRWRLRFKALGWYKSGRHGFVFWLSQSVWVILYGLVVKGLSQPKGLAWLGIDPEFYLWLLVGVGGLVVFWFWAGYGPGRPKRDWWFLLKLKSLIKLG